eukprot:220497-Pleurochrysis_carterae.AAC.1
MQREGSKHRRPRLESNTGAGESHSFAFLLLLLFPPNESDIRRRAKRAFQEQISQNMRGKKSQLSVESNVFELN